MKIFMYEHVYINKMLKSMLHVVLGSHIKQLVVYKLFAVTSGGKTYTNFRGDTQNQVGDKT